MILTTHSSRVKGDNISSIRIHLLPVCGQWVSVTPGIVLVVRYLSEQSCLTINTIIVCQSATMMHCNQFCLLLSMVFYGNIKTLIIVVNDIVRSKRRHKETVSRVALPIKGSDTKIIAK